MNPLVLCCSYARIIFQLLQNVSAMLQFDPMAIQNWTSFSPDQI